MALQQAYPFPSVPLDMQAPAPRILYLQKDLAGRNIQSGPDTLFVSVNATCDLATSYRPAIMIMHATYDRHASLAALRA